jgi:ATP-dependent Clp protease ATP-binding subunit ClpA
MLERFTDKARRAVVLAREKASEHGDDRIGLLHVLYALVTGDGVASKALAALGVDAAAVDRELGPARRPGTQTGGTDAEALKTIGIDLDEIKRKIEETFGEGALERMPLTRKGPLNWTGPRIPFGDEAKLTLGLSLAEARALHDNYIGTEHVLLGLLRAAERNPRGEFAAVTLPDLGLDPATARDRVLAELTELHRRYRPG